MLKGKDVLGLREMSKDEILEILDVAKEMKARIDNPELRVDELKHTSIITLFYRKTAPETKNFHSLWQENFLVNVEDSWYCHKQALK